MKIWKFAKKRKIVVVDPGNFVLSYMMDKNHKKLKYTACQRRVESRSKRCQKITLEEKKRNSIQLLEQRLSSQNSKTVNYNKFKKIIYEKKLD